MQEHGRMGHGQTLYEEVVRVPLVFHGPGNLPAGLRPGTASLLDVAPTILELVSEAVAPGELDGVSQAGRMKPAGASAPSAPPPAAERELLLHLDLDIGGHALALRGERLKLVLAQKPFRKELFDHRQDPREQSSRLAAEAGAGSMPALAERLADRYNELSGRALPRATNVAPEKLEAMAALGYVGAGRSVSIRRVIPDRIRPADAQSGGSLGWPVP
jgi:arylsulfatase A-like enzyme